MSAPTPGRRHRWSGRHHWGGHYTWWRALEPDQLGEGRVTTVTLGHRTLAITRFNGGYGALDNRCPHQGGPLGEGSIERGWLRCPWHGYDYSPCNGTPPPPFTDSPASYPVEVRADGVWVALPDEKPRTRTVADVVVETMVNWGVTHVFGMVGHSNLGLADAFREAASRGSLTFIGIRHEGAAAFAAGAYGKLTGRPAACFGIAGPGSTNLLTGLYDAKADRAPVLALSGQVPSKELGRGAFQDVDLNGAFSDVARYSKTAQADSNHAELVSLACKTAIVERDVAHLVFPDEVQNLPADDGQRAGAPGGRVGDLRVAPPAEALAAALAALGEARRPLIIVGAGAHDAMTDVVALAEHLGAPVMTTFKAKGLMSDRHPLGCGVLGRSGTPVASWFMNESDLVVAFGASFSNHTGIADYKPIIQVDRDPMALGRFHAVTVPVLGDVGVTARALLDGLPDTAARNDLRDEVAQRRALWHREKQRRRADDRGRGVGSAAIFDALTATVPDDAVLCVDVGNNAYSFGRYFESSGNQDVLMSGYLGSIGFALPAAMGAWAAVGGTRKVVSVSGDGGFGQYAMELTTLAKYDMPITHVLLDNGELGKISKEQRAGEWDVWQTSLRNPDFAAFAELCGVRGFRVGQRAELDAALRAALAHPGPALVHIVNDPQLVIMVTSLPITTITARDPRQEARAVAGPGYDPRVLEPSPPAVTEPPWWADDPVDPMPAEPGARVVSPVPGLGDLTWSRWAASDHAVTSAWLSDRWLARYQRLPRPPAGYGATRTALHRLAVYVLSPARQRASEGKMALRYTRGGFGTPFFGSGEQVRVEGPNLIRQRDGRAWMLPLSTLAEAAAFVLDGAPATQWAAGLDVPPVGDVHGPLDVSPRAAAFLGAWYGFAWSVLEEVRADAESVDVSRVQLWPEHFGAAFECLQGARRAGFGMSPGDATHPHPYAYVTLWHPDAVPDDPHWNAEAFRGAILPLAEFVTADDQRRAVIEFFRAHRRLLTRSTPAD